MLVELTILMGVVFIATLLAGYDRYKREQEKIARYELEHASDVVSDTKLRYYNELAMRQTSNPQLRVFQDSHFDAPIEGQAERETRLVDTYYHDSYWHDGGFTYRSEK